MLTSSGRRSLPSCLQCRGAKAVGPMTAAHSCCARVSVCVCVCGRTNTSLSSTSLLSHSSPDRCRAARLALQLRAGDGETFSAAKDEKQRHRRGTSSQSKKKKKGLLSAGLGGNALFWLRIMIFFFSCLLNWLSGKKRHSWDDWWEQSWKTQFTVQLFNKGQTRGQADPFFSIHPPGLETEH